MSEIKCQLTEIKVEVHVRDKTAPNQSKRNTLQVNSSKGGGVAGNGNKMLVADLDADMFREYHVLVIDKRPSVDV